jgi:hypothetical protein
MMMKRRFMVMAMMVVATSVGLAEDQIYFKPPDYVGPPQPEQAVTNRAFQGIPSLAVTPGGRLWATWYAGVTPAEDQNNYVVLSTSGDGGVTWQGFWSSTPMAQDRVGPSILSSGLRLTAACDWPGPNLWAMSARLAESGF